MVNYVKDVFEKEHVVVERCDIRIVRDDLCANEQVKLWQIDMVASYVGWAYRLDWFGFCYVQLWDIYETGS